MNIEFEKDYFSSVSNEYQKFRPHYPPELFNFIYSHVKNFEAAWDCGTGNGQAAVELSKKFKEVTASDFSIKQIQHAFIRDNIQYHNLRSEETEFPDSYFDLITAAQSVHWFNFEKYFNEVKRTGKNGSIIAVWGYGLPEIEKEINILILNFYENILKDFWDERRIHVEKKYKSIPFPFNEIPSPEFNMKTKWTFENFCGFIKSWSSVNTYIKLKKEDPTKEFFIKLSGLWEKEENKEINFPIFLRIGKIEK